MPSHTIKAIATPARTAGRTPLEHMLFVMNDETAAPTRRDRMAIAAAQYCHQRMADTRVPKKARQAKAASEAGAGTGWADDLDYTDGKPRQ